MYNPDFPYRYKQWPSDKIDLIWRLSFLRYSSIFLSSISLNDGPLFFTSFSTSFSNFNLSSSSFFCLLSRFFFFNWLVLYFIKGFTCWIHERNERNCKLKNDVMRQVSISYLGSFGKLSFLFFLLDINKLCSFLFFR